MSMLARRRFLALGSGAALIGLGNRAWALAGDAPVKQRFVVIMLRGAVDGLNVVAPYGDSRYSDMRPSIALDGPGKENGVLDLDGHFGLHPALASLMPLWHDRRLAFVHACGSPDPTRSHFEAQDFLESATPGVHTTSDGWMNRLIQALPGPVGPTRAISIGATRPRILAGREPTSNFPLGPNAGKPGALDRPAISQAFSELYSGNDAMGVAYREGQQARIELASGMMQSDEAMMAADNGAPNPNGFPATARRLARLMVADDRIQLAFADLGGWDTHVNQGNAKGQLAGRLQPLGEGMAALAQALGPKLDDTVVVVMSEFGRTAHENGNRGTDHGHGNVMWVMGGRVVGGKVHGRWPGRAREALYEERDLAVTTDYRSVLAAVLRAHMGLVDGKVAAVLPMSPAYDGPLPGLFSL